MGSPGTNGVPSVRSEDTLRRLTEDERVIVYNEFQATCDEFSMDEDRTELDATVSSVGSACPTFA